MKKNLASLQLKTSSFATLALYLCVAFFYGCGGSNSNGSGEEPVLPKNVNVNANKGNAFAYGLEIPKLNSDNRFIRHSTNYNGKDITTYTMEYNDFYRHSVWIAFTFTKSVSTNNWNRNNWKQTEWGGDPFQVDPQLPEIYQIKNEQHVGDGYDKGHLCASADRLYSKDANEQTFYLSNISPQLANFNQGIWANLEGLVQNWGKNDDSFRDTLFVVKGGTIKNGQRLSQTNHGLTVPKYYFMAILCKYNNSSLYRAIAFWFEHKSYGSTETVRSHAITIDELEELTGIDFFCNLPDKIEDSVEKELNISQWPGLSNK